VQNHDVIPAASRYNFDCAAGSHAQLGNLRPDTDGLCFALQFKTLLALSFADSSWNSRFLHWSASAAGQDLLLTLPPLTTSSLHPYPGRFFVDLFFYTAVQVLLAVLSFFYQPPDGMPMILQPPASHATPAAGAAPEGRGRRQGKGTSPWPLGLRRRSPCARRITWGCIPVSAT